MHPNEIVVEEHPLRKMITEQRVTLWRLKLALGEAGPSENKLSRVLRGLDGMPHKPEEQIRAVLSESANEIEVEQ